MTQQSQKVVDFKQKEQKDFKNRFEVVERVGTQEELAQLYAKLAKTTAEIVTIEKNGYNSYHKYNYARADDIYKVVSKILADKHNIWMTTMTLDKEINKIHTDKGTYTEIFLEKYFSFNDGDTGAYVGLKYYGYDVDKTSKFLYKAYTGALKYFLRDNFMISTGDPDPEMDNPVADKPAKRTKDSNLKAGNMQIIKTYWGRNTEVVKEIALEFLQERGENDISKLSSYDDEELGVVVKRINNRLKD